MDKLIIKTDYILALAENNMTDEIRNNYYNSFLNKEEGCLEGFSLILKETIQNIKQKHITKNEGLIFIQNEFNQANMSNYLTEFSNYDSFIELLFSRINAGHEKITIEFFKPYIQIADNLPNKKISISIYFSVLNMLTASQLLTEDLEFSKKIINYVKSYGKLYEIDKIFLNLIYSSLNFHN